jgi:predicted DNA-binding transcriptional regulator YafY
VGQRSQTETLAGIYQAFLQKRTWKQKDLSKELDIGVEPLRRVLHELCESGMPLQREDDHPHVYWSVPKDWFPNSVIFKREDVPELMRQLRRIPLGPGRTHLLELVLPQLPRGQAPTAPDLIVTHETSVQENQYLGVVEDSGNGRVPLRMRYYTASRGVASERHVSVHRVIVGPPARFVATCHRSGTLKTFRVDSIMNARLDDAEPYIAADDVAIEAYCRASLDGFNEGGAPVPVSFRVRNPEARWVRNNLLEGVTTEELEDGVRIIAHTAAIGRLARFVTSLGAAAIAETPALAEEVAVLARGALRSIAMTDAGQPPGMSPDPATAERSRSRV